ncbi:tetratricopeptide repeat protein [Flavobacterium sp. XS2P12]|uniref:tetratricopeptide repeat protein n=1 Tax=Flavobacterium melibiosi TaxID=3398734 RepID=UPI003A8818D8
MKKLLYYLTLLLLFSYNASAQSARETLNQYIAQLQKSPDDNALREKIILLAQKNKPAPAITDEAREKYVMAITLRDDKEYELALSNINETLLITPWWGDAYKELGLTLGLVKKYDEAILAYQLYIKTLTDDEVVSHVKDEIAIMKAKKMKAEKEQNELNKIVRSEEEKRQVVNAKRDVITKIKNAINNRSYQQKNLGYNKNGNWSAGVNQYELFGGGTYYMFSFDFYVPIYWKFFDNHVEMWGNFSGKYSEQILRGESWGPKVSDMRWFQVNTITLQNGMQVWAYFDLQNAYLYSTLNGWTMRPVNDSEFDPKTRYNYVLYKPVD